MSQPLSNIPLPISAEDLLKELRTNPQSMGRHLRSDLVGMDKNKAIQRHFSMLFNHDPEIQK